MTGRWREYARQYGTLGLFKHVVARVAHPVWEKASVIVLAHHPPALVVSAKVPLRVMKLTPTTAYKAGWAVEGWEQRWARGEVCYGGWVGDKCVHYSWVSRVDSYIGEVHQWLKLGKEEAYIYDCFTDGGSRGQRIFPAVLSSIAQDLFSEGVSTIWIAAETNNRSSIRAIKRAGFSPVGEIKYRRIGPFVEASTNPVTEGQQLRTRQFSLR